MNYKIIDDMEISGEALTALIDRLPAWRRAEALKFKFESGRRECAMAYLLLADMLGFQPEFQRSEHGKPSVAGSSVAFNLSHCKRAIACAVCENGDVGIDVECLGRYKPQLAEYCMSDEELRQIGEAEDSDEAFTLLWTKKEALLKLTGEGITDDMKYVLESDRMNGVKFVCGCNRERGYAWSVAVRDENENENETLRYENENDNEDENYK